MGRISQILSFVRTTRRSVNVSDVTCDSGGGDNKTAEHFAPVGDDSHPLIGDYVATTTAAGTGRKTALGYFDPKLEPKSDPGEKRIYARDSGGAEVCEVWLKNTGAVSISNANGFILLQADGNVNINGAIIDTGGNVTTAAGVSVNAHTHNQANDSGGDSEQATNPPNAG